MHTINTINSIDDAVNTNTNNINNNDNHAVFMEAADEDTKATDLNSIMRENYTSSWNLPEWTWKGKSTRNEYKTIAALHMNKIEVGPKQ